jgi:hypothetical protein
MPAKGDKGDAKGRREVEVSIPADLHSVLRYIGQVDGTSVPAVVSRMIDNGIRQRKATDAGIRNYARRSS